MRASPRSANCSRFGRSAETGKLATLRERALGDVHGAGRRGDDLDLGGKSEVATRRNPDGSVSFVTTRPGIIGFEFVVGNSGGKRTLITRDGQHEYVFTEK